MVAFLKAFNLDSSVLLVMANGDEKVRRAAGNIKKLSTMPVELINCYDVVKNVKVVFAKEAIEKLQETYDFQEEEQEAAE